MCAAHGKLILHMALLLKDVLCYNLSIDKSTLVLIQIGCTLWLVNLLLGISWDIMRNGASKICLWGRYFDLACDWGLNIFTWIPVTMSCSLVSQRFFCWTLSILSCFLCAQLFPFVSMRKFSMFLVWQRGIVVQTCWNSSSSFLCVIVSGVVISLC